MLNRADRNWRMADPGRAMRRAGIIVVCLALAWLIGYPPIVKQVPLLVGGVAGLAVLVVCMFRPAVGVLLLVTTTLFLRLSFATGTGSPLSLSLVFAFALTLVWLVRMLVEDKRIRLLPSRLNRPLVAFIVVALLSTVWSNLVRDPQVRLWSSFPRVQLGALSTMILSASVTLLIANQLRATRHLKILVSIFLIAAVVGLAEVYTPLNLSFLNIGGLFPLWVITFAGGQALFNTSMSRRLRIALAGLAMVWFLYQFGHGITWKSGWIPPLIAGFIMVALRSRKLLIGLIILTLVFAIAQRESLFQTLATENVESGVTRLAAWEVNWQFTREHLFLGMGPAGYAVYYMTYVPDQAMATHSNYIDIVSQLGLIGSLVFGWLLVAAGRAAWDLPRRVPRGSFEYALACSLPASFVALVVAMALGDWVLPFAYTQGIGGYDYTVWGWMSIGLIMILRQRYASPANAEVRGAG